MIEHEILTGTRPSLLEAILNDEIQLIVKPANYESSSSVPVVVVRS